MAITWPAKNNYATGDVLTATNMNGIGDDLNALFDNSFYAGKNKIINGDFGINQRNFTSITTDNSFCFDRWQLRAADGTVTVTPQVFTLGSAPVSGYGGTNYLQTITTGQTLTTARASNGQNIEDVRLLAGQTITVSLWAKAGSGTPNIAVELTQVFGTGGSPSATVTGILASTPKQAISTSWARYSWTISVPSITGKTIGTDANSSYTGVNIWFSAGSSFDARTGTLGIQSNTFQIWGVQVETGSTATPFQTATGTKQGELAACQRYYYRQTPGSNAYGLISQTGVITSATNAQLNIQYPVPMRVTPTAVEYASIRAVYYTAAGAFSVSAVALASTSNSTLAAINCTISGATANIMAYLTADNSTSGYLGFNAEL